MVKLSGPSVPAKSGRTESLVILCHGYGASGEDLIDLSSFWADLLPNTAFVSPDAPERLSMGPGYQWFPIQSLDPDEINRGVRGAASILDGFIDEQLALHKLDDSRMALVGFSQGTMMSLHVGLRRAKAPAGILGYSGALAAEESLKAEVKNHAPVFLVHGDADEMLPVARMHLAVRALAEAEVNVQWHVSHGVGHGIDPEGLDIGGSFLKSAFAGAFA